MSRTACFPIVHLMASGCSDDPQWAGAMEVRDGIEVVVNPREPLMGDVPGIVSPLWSVREPAWQNPSLVHAGSGLLFLVDRPANRIHVVTQSGEARASLGRSGDGPGEFLQLRDAFPTGDRLVVLDGGRVEMTFLDFDGNLLSSLRVGSFVAGGFALGRGEYLMSGQFGVRDDPFLLDARGRTGGWVRFSASHEPIPFTPALEPLPEDQGVQCSRFSSWPGGAARLRMTTPQIQVFDGAGNQVTESWIGLPAKPTSDAEMESVLSGMRSELANSGLPPEFQQQSLRVMEERYRVKCRFGPLVFDTSLGLAALLEQEPSELGSGNATLHFLSRNGIYLARVSFANPWRDFTLGDGVVYALVQDPATDMVTLRAYRVDLPDSVFSRAVEVLEGARRRATTHR